jgi:hypothetical protein
MKRSLLVLAILGGLAGRAAAQEALPGPFKFDMKFGPAIGIIDHSGAQFHLGMDFGINVTPSSPHHIYIDIPLAFNFGDEHTDIMLVPGIEADILLPVGVPIYIYPMFGLGLGFVTPSCPRGFDCPDYTALVIRLGAGVKYVLQGRWNFFFEPFNLDFWPAGSNHDLYGTPGHYTMLFGAGVNF